jgi:catechol 2,3-dioxygenase-like lactoylglutathione lyase family enzyme
VSLTFHSSVIFVKDIEKAKKIYTEILNQQIEHDFGNNIIFKSGLSLWQIDPNHEISKIAGDPRAGNTFELYFETDDIRKCCEVIKTSGLNILHDIKTESWGQMTFRFFDCDGHLIEIGEALEKFITRIYNETQSTHETSVRTGVPESMILKIIGVNKN